MYFEKHELDDLPRTPGVYKWCDAQGEVVYVGKAKNLRVRVRSYVRKSGLDIKTRVMMRRAVRVEVIETSTENEALILENQLIKSLKPKYNILLKDDKTFPYIKVTVQEPFPRIIVTRVKQRDGARYYGPFPSMGSSRAVKRLLYELFPVRDCKLTITLTEQQPKCMLLDIGKCLGPCIYKDIKPEYDALVGELHALLMGKDRSVMRRLKKEMLAHADKEEFEKAAASRDKLALLERLTELQRVDIADDNSYQLWAYVERDNMMYVMLQQIVKGKLIGQNGYYEEKRDAESPQFFVERCINQHPLQKGSQLLGNERVASLYQGASCQVPKRGFKHDLIENLERNASMAVLRVLKNKPVAVDDIDVLERLKHALKLSRYPKRIIGIDISHLQGQNMVGSAVCFVDGVPDKSGYRQFNIKTVQGHSHDPQAIREVVIRYLNLCKKEQSSYPDLIVIDGGKGQLNFAFSGLSQAGLVQDIDILSLAKRNEEVFRPGESQPYRFNRHELQLRVLQHVRDESHRFALRRSKERRGKMGGYQA